MEILEIFGHFYLNHLSPLWGYFSSRRGLVCPVPPVGLCPADWTDTPVLGGWRIVRYPPVGPSGRTFSVVLPSGYKGGSLPLLSVEGC